MSNFENVKKFMKTFGQEIKEKAGFPDDKITSLRYELIKEELDEFLLEVRNKKLKLMEEEFGDLFFSIINYGFHKSSWSFSNTSNFDIIFYI